MLQRGPEPRADVVSRSGEPRASIAVGSRRVSLSSVFDAQAEARRWAEGLGANALVQWGASGPEAWREGLDRQVSVLFAVEPRLEVWQSVLSWHDLTDLLGSPRWYALWGSPQTCIGWISGRFHPLWDGGLVTRDWRVSTGDEQLWEPYRSRLSQALGSWVGDFSTQARFGARWYRNTWMNLRNLASPALDLRPRHGAIVTGAGPGLELALEQAESLDLLENRPQNGWLLLATDTSLPALTARGLTPDAVLCLDGQQPSAHHFHPPRPEGLRLLADIASIPLLHRVGLQVFPFLSANPLGTIIGRWYTGFTQLDGSTGNVSGLGVSVAQRLGAPEIRLWGTDFSYPAGKTYARGTYVYPLNDRRSDRLRPSETRLSAGCYGAGGLERLGSQVPWRYTTPLLREYRSRMFSGAAEQPGRLVVPSVDGWPDVAQSLQPPLPPAAWPAIEGNSEALREDWRKRLASLPRPRRGEGVPQLMMRIPADRREDWLALWPLGLAIQRVEGTGEGFIDRLVARALEPVQD